MDTRDGRIYNESELMKKFKELSSESIRNIWEKKFKSNGELKYFKPMEIPPTEKQMVRKPPRVGRNDPCSCGSGKKFKKCCLITNWKERYR